MPSHRPEESLRSVTMRFMPIVARALEASEIIMKEGNKINKYTPSEQQGSGAKGKRVGIAYELENGEIIYVPE